MREISGILANTKELKELIAKYPTYPIAILCGENSNCGDHSWMYATDIKFGAGELLDCKQPINDEIVFNDRDTFYERLEEYLEDHLEPLTEKEFQQKFEEEKKKYEQYWKNCIFIYANN